MYVARWLRGLRLEQYEQVFRDNDIDSAVLPSLTAEDLKELGIASVGHRRRVLEAITALRERGEPAGDTSAITEAERRQLTLMFCDLVGSTELSTNLDREDLREVFAAYHRGVAETVGRFAESVAKYKGDGVLVYFGYPQAHEDDAERAVRAGLALIEGITEVTAPASVQIRIGLATGLVVVGDLIGTGAAQEQAVVGETPYLAARLQSLAQPGALLIDANTRRLLGDLFEFHNLGAVEAKGFAGAVPACQVLRPSESRFEALRASSLTPLVGREEEIEFLLAAGPAPRKVMGRWCWSLASPALASRGLPPRSPIGCATSRASASAISARLITRTVPSIPSLPSSSAPRGSHARILLQPG
jgi:class 3 adenylate cyclase